MFGKIRQSFRQGCRDSFFADKVLFPSKVKRIGFYLWFLSGIGMVGLGGYLMRGFDVKEGLIIFFVMAMAGIYLMLMACLCWMSQATHYIVKKEA